MPTIVMPLVITCSYCEAPATHMGAGQDGDLYCQRHVAKAPVQPVLLHPGA